MGFSAIRRAASSSGDAPCSSRHLSSGCALKETGASCAWFCLNKFGNGSLPHLGARKELLAPWTSTAFRTLDQPPGSFSFVEKKRALFPSARATVNQKFCTKRLRLRTRENEPMLQTLELLLIRRSPGVLPGSQKSKASHWHMFKRNTSAWRIPLRFREMKNSKNFKQD